MKTIKFFATLLMLFVFTTHVNAQFDKKQMKQIEKDVKAMEKEGWKVKPGGLSLLDQQIRAKKVQLEEDDEGNALWQIGAASSEGSIYDAARMQAMVLAKTELANAISASVTAKYASEASNKQSGGGSVESMAETAMKTQQVTVDQKLSNPRILFEAYMTKPNGNVEVNIRLAIKRKVIEDTANEIFEKTKKNFE